MTAFLTPIACCPLGDQRSHGAAVVTQLIYSDGPGPITGWAVMANPDVGVDFDAGDRIVGAFGNFDRYCCWFKGFWNLGFWMASGKQYGPYGRPPGPYGNPFTFLGNIYATIISTQAWGWTGSDGIYVRPFQQKMG